MKNKVCFVMPYFGKFPSYFNLWLNFCRNNPSFNWLFFTDDKTNYHYPENVLVKHLSLSEFKKLIESKIKINITLDRPYKICDFRPLFGIIFEDYLNDYDFWGYGDLDTIIGNLSKFVTDDSLNKYEKISLMGHLSILKNSKLVNEAYRDCDYISIITNKNNINFDEIRYVPNFNSLLKKRNCNILEYFEKFDICFEHHCFYNYEYNGTNRVTIKDYHASIFEYDNGNLYGYKIIDNKIIKNELAYVHFIKRKIFLTNDLNYNHFVFIPNTFKSDYHITDDFIIQNTKDNYIELLFNELNRLFNSIKRRLSIGK